MASTRRRMGDRKDGRLIRSLNPFSKFSYKGIGILHFLIATHIRTASMLPGVNRFIAGRRVYAHNDITVVMTVKHSLSIDATETTIKVHFQPTDTIFDVYRKMNEKIEEIKTAEEDNNTEEVAGFFAKFPRFLVRFALAVVRALDYFGWLPESIMEASPFHGSMIITDLGSLRIGPVYHHIYNFGTLPVFIAFGAKYHKYEISRKRELVESKYIDTKMVIDEGIVDGHYYAQLVQAYRYMFQHPEILENPPTKVVEDIF